jgi:hypothetical protein
MMWASGKLRDICFAPENPKSVSGRARARRWERLLERFPRFEEMRVLDLGGTPHSWSFAPVRPRELTVLNLTPYESTNEMRCLCGDACDPPPELAHRSFDLVYSNSVIEHLGGHRQRRAFAETVKAAAPHHWVQTPARSFPIEPHWLFPAFQWLPLGLRVSVSSHWPLGFAEADRADRCAVTEEVLSVELLSAAEMAHLFPGSSMLYERFMGLAKSIVAVR